MPKYKERRSGIDRRQPDDLDRRSGKDRRGNTNSNLELIDQERFEAWLKEYKEP